MSYVMSRIRQAGFLVLKIDVQTVWQMACPAKGMSFKCKGCTEDVQMPGDFLIWPLVIPSLPKFLSSSGFWAKESQKSSL